LLKGEGAACLRQPPVNQAISHHVMATTLHAEHEQPLKLARARCRPHRSLDVSVWLAAWWVGFCAWLASPIVPAAVSCYRVYVAGGNREDLLVLHICLLIVFQIFSGIVYGVVTPLVIWPVLRSVKHKPAWWRPCRACACAVGASFVPLAGIATVLTIYFGPRVSVDTAPAMLQIGMTSLCMGIPAGLAASSFCRYHYASLSSYS
jgi:hypothetical protein